MGKNLSFDLEHQVQNQRGAGKSKKYLEENYMQLWKRKEFRCNNFHFLSTKKWNILVFFFISKVQIFKTLTLTYIRLKSFVGSVLLWARITFSQLLSQPILNLNFEQMYVCGNWLPCLCSVRRNHGLNLRPNRKTNTSLGDNLMLINSNNFDGLFNYFFTPNL